jgi:hypothetical protein
MRLATYHGEGFKEGVSLTVFDELARWEKYAYGTNELVFNPLRKWYKGPITRLYLTYFGSNIKSSSKLMVLSYTFTYYAIAAGLPLTLLNYLLVGWFSDFLDQFYVNSWKVIVVILILFDVIVRFPSPFNHQANNPVPHILLHNPTPSAPAVPQRLHNPNRHLDPPNRALLLRDLLPPIQSCALSFLRGEYGVDCYCQGTRNNRVFYWYGSYCEGF